MSNENISKAFVAAQKSFAPALKTATNPHFKSKYADLSACVEAVIDALNSQGIALIQNTHESDNGVIVETVFLHESGESISAGKLHVPAAKHDPQGYGSALTYARRYSLMASCGIAPEDDDGNQASKPITQEQAEQLKRRLESTESDVKKFCSALGIKSVDQMPASMFKKADDMVAHKEASFAKQYAESAQNAAQEAGQ